MVKRGEEWRIREGWRICYRGEGYKAMLLMRNCFPSIFIARVIAEYSFMPSLDSFSIKAEDVIFGHSPFITVLLATYRKNFEFRGIQLKETNPRCGNERCARSNWWNGSQRRSSSKEIMQFNSMVASYSRWCGFMAIFFNHKYISKVCGLHYNHPSSPSPSPFVTTHLTLHH